MLQTNVADGIHRVEDASTNRTGPRLVARAATVDSRRRGDPWNGGAAAGVERARAEGAA